MNARRKTRSTSARGGRGGKGAERQVSADGVYTNHRFMQAVGALVGLPVRIQTKTNEIIEGVFTTFSPNFDLVLDLAHQVSRSDPSTINPETIKPKMIFTAADIVTIKVANVDLEYATRDGFAVDQVISRYNGQGGEKPLEPWQGDPSTDDCIGLGDENSLGNIPGLPSQNGWDVDDMFRKNEEKYGVTTSYTPDMEGYTTRLYKLNTPEYREREAKASRIAAEIEKSPTTQVRLDAENGDEEERFSAVLRPGEQGGKYIPPMLRKKNQNGGKAQRATPPPTGARYNSHGSSNPPTPTSPYPGPPPTGSAGHSPVGLPGASPAYQPQQPPQQLPNHALPPAQHQPIHRNNSQGSHHGHAPDTKVNGDAKNSYDRKGHDGPPVDASGREVRHNNSHGGKQQQQQQQQDLHPRHHGPPHSEPAHMTQQQAQQQQQQQQQQQAQQQQHQKPIPQKPPPQQHHQHTSHMPPVGQGDHRKAEPREQREPRKMRNKEEQIADLKKFSEDFKLSDQPEKKAQGQGQQQQPQQQQQQQQPPQQQQQHHHQHQHQQPPPPTQQQQQQPPPTSQPPPPQAQPHPQPQPQTQPPPQPQQQPPPPQQQPPQPPQLQQPPPPTPQQHHQHHQQQPPPPQPQQPPPPQQQPPPPIPQTHLPPQHLPPQQHPQPQRQTPPVTSVTMGPPQTAQQPPPHHPQNPPTMTMSPAAEMSKPHDEMEKIATTVTHSKLNPNAKEFVFNPHAKPFSPRSPSTTTPPRPHTPQTPQIPPNQPPQLAPGPPVGIPHMVLTSQSFAIQPQPPRFPKRVPVGGSQRPEYTSPLQVAAATGQPILAPAPMGTQTQPITTVQIPQNIMPQTPQHYQQYPGVPIVMRFPPTGMPMMAAMVPNSMGLCHPNPDSQQPSQQHGHQTMYMAQTSLPPHQPHPAHTPGPVPQPTQPPTPQNPGGGSGPPNMPNPPSTPGPTPPQSLIYPMGGQPSLPQHLPQHSPHPAPSPHTQQYPGPGQGGAGSGGHHGGPGQMTAQYVVLPHHMMHHSGPPPHSAAAHIPSSMPGFTPTSTATVQQLPSHIQYFPSTAGSHGHPMSLVHHSQ
ncbi:ataxin-2 homolog isoform X4 [Eriocheir sinensis]|uniref:ataxin-2 homolog isoform X4 n=1 Tax=Eriocheir sinensis TaxID=95602 RepID=UPI0021C6835C|nr:ataxin-2 homolog isoform X4 [Eriocheir sinensis]